MPDFANLPLILAGPIVRRVEPASVSVWVALSSQSQVELGLWTGQVVASTASGTNFGNGTAAHTATANSIRLGEKLHLALVTLDLTAAPLTPGTVYSYNILVTAAGNSKDLNGLGLLEDKTTEPKHLALGYVPNQLPSFALPPLSLEHLTLAQGSCRKAHGGGPDALAGLDKLIKDNLADGTRRPHQLFLTGDQIYADDIASVLLPELNAVGNALLGVDEKLKLNASTELTAPLANFPATWRQQLITQTAKFTSHEAANHALSFGEYCALYLLFWSNLLWPDSLKKKHQVFTEEGESAAAVDSLPAHLKSLYPAGATSKARKRKVKDRDKLKRDDSWEKEVEAVKEFRKALPKVRRALANVATYMIFDDHEVTDDWYLVKHWRDRVLTAPLGVNILRNGLLSYTLFQGWGNTPKQFVEDSDHAALLAAVPNLFPAAGGPHAATAASLDSLFGFDGSTPKIKWHYSVASGPTQTLVLDTRTRREFASQFAPPGLLTQAALDEQIPDSAIPSAGAEALIVVSAAPVLGLALIEEVFQPVMARGAADVSNAISAAFNNQEPEITGYQEWDMEAWCMAPVRFEALLNKLQKMRKVIIISGDVHYSFSSELDYWKKGGATPARIIELCSSALKNEWPQVMKRVLSTGTGQRILQHAVYPLERVAWENDLSITGEVHVPAGQAIPGTYRSLMKVSPVLLPTEGWPAGTTVSIQPDWSWRSNLLHDQRLDDSSAGARPSEGQIGNISPDISLADPMTGYLAVQKRHEKLVTRKTPRSVLHNSNLGLITFSGTGATLKVKHDFYYFHPEGEKTGDPKPYTSHEASLAPSSATPPAIGS